MRQEKDFFIGFPLKFRNMYALPDLFSLRSRRKSQEILASSDKNGTAVW